MFLLNIFVVARCRSKIIKIDRKYRCFPDLWRHKPAGSIFCQQEPAAYWICQGTGEIKCNFMKIIIYHLLAIIKYESVEYGTLNSISKVVPKVSCMAYLGVPCLRVVDTSYI